MMTVVGAGQRVDNEGWVDFVDEQIGFVVDKWWGELPMICGIVWGQFFVVYFWGSCALFIGRLRTMFSQELSAVLGSH